MKRLCVCVLALGLATAGRAEEKAKAAGKAGKEATVVAPADAKWQDGERGVHVAPLWGNADKGAHGRFLRLAGGTDNPPHTHSSTLHTIVVSGTFYQGADAASAKDAGAGTFIETPANWKHVSGCRAGADCVVYESSSGKFDYKPVGAKGPAAKKKGEEKE